MADTLAHDWRPSLGSDVHCSVCDALVTRRNDLRITSPCPGVRT